MDIDYNYFIFYRKFNAAWNILCAQRAPLILSFVHEAFILHSRTSAPEGELCDILGGLILKINNMLRTELGFSPDDDVALVNERIEQLKKEEAEAEARAAAGEKPKRTRKKRAPETGLLVEDPLYFLKAWSAEESRYFRCTHQGASGSEPYYDITPDLQKAYSFVIAMQETQGSFVPTASRFRDLLAILQEVQMSTEGNADAYIEQLEAQKAELDRKIALAKKGVIEALSPAQIRERFIQFQHDAISLADDFRQVEYNLNDLDKEIMQDILNWTGPRGDLLAKYFDKNSYIENTDQGRSVKSFAHLLLSGDDDDLIVNRIQKLLNHPAIRGMTIDERLPNIHDQWLNLRMNIERVMGASTKRIKSFLQPQNLDANQGLKERIRSITDSVAILTKEEGLAALPKELLTLEFPRAEITSALDRPLYTVPDKMEFSTDSHTDSFVANDDKLFNQVVVDPAVLINHIHDVMGDRDSVSLPEIIASFPLKHGVTELTTYVKIALVGFDVVEDSEKQDLIKWEAIDFHGNKVLRVAKINHITIHRK